MQRNGDIRGFFAKKPTPAGSNPPSSWSQPLGVDLPSSPITPQKAAVRAPLSRDDEIKGSDEDDSDDSLGSLTDFFGRKGGPSSAFQRKPNAASTTPKAKRTASGPGFHSPLTLQNKPQRHKFDLKALVNHARQDNATDESARRAGELLREAAADVVEKYDDSGSDQDPEIMRDTARKLFDDGEKDSKGDKFVRAMNRTQGDDTRSWYYFFDPAGPPRDVSRSPFPKKAAKGQWGFLSPADGRDLAFVRGIPIAIAIKGKELPDELFEWILSEICVEKNLQLRGQYMNLVSRCFDDTRRLVDDRQLYSMLEKIGGPKHSLKHGKFELSPGFAQAHLGRDWSPLVSFLQILAEMAPNMSPSNVIAAVQMLLRMSLDPVVSCIVQVRSEYDAAMTALASALPKVEEQWNACCNQICSYLHEGVETASQRSVAVRLMPLSRPRVCDLRRRLAAMALFGNPDLGRKHPDQTLTFHDIFTRIDEDDFNVTHSTDFAELNALIALLDIVVDDGEHLRAKVGPSFSSNPADPDAEATKFDAEVDHLAFKLKAIHDKLNDNSQISRKEAKLALDSIGKRLTYEVRSRPPPKTSIFDAEPEEDASLPKQRDFMKKWAQRKTDAKAGKENTPAGAND
ncbi:uncharacterized protein BCR38DRAFT_482976 [Pseudomassariella vexata]|uniref:Uncharacterized protein n=1 Tax=Pseudomassariella vexata TaxID=1141098 RepID=A0A1Y2E7U3_9PEZI|nr:uncharacterized protein BCR38DRAFT_482976 [Pseudomassariella vexata]ORY67356.1 hypothetical protein BCR38DRAFT_482976 [Pseudomassariella vexata]